jgi:hypothetical protein
MRRTSASATTTPGVNATPYNVTAHPWTSDGCTWVPDNGTHSAYVYIGRYPYGTSVLYAAWWDFNHACMHHDGCYRGHWRDRATCDAWFLNDMNASCAALHPSNSAARYVCGQKASQYYSGVRAFGQRAYDRWTHEIAMA